MARKKLVSLAISFVLLFIVAVICYTERATVLDLFRKAELPWLLAHFDRVILCSYYGVAEITDYIRTVLPIVIQQTRRGGWRGTSAIYFNRMAEWRAAR